MLTDVLTYHRLNQGFTAGGFYGGVDLKYHLRDRFLGGF